MGILRELVAMGFSPITQWVIRDQHVKPAAIEGWIPVIGFTPSLLSEKLNTSASQGASWL